MPLSGVGRMIDAELATSSAKGAALSKLQGEKFSPEAMSKYPPKGSAAVCPACGK